MSFYYRERDLMEELFLKACVPEIEKLMPYTGNCCRGCMEGIGNQLGHACLSDVDSFERSCMEREEMKRATILLQPKITEILKQIRELITTEKPKYDSITVSKLLDFFCGEPDSTPPLVRLVWDPEWQRLSCDLINMAPGRRYAEEEPNLQDTLEYNGSQGGSSGGEEYGEAPLLSDQETDPISLFD